MVKLRISTKLIDILDVIVLIHKFAVNTILVDDVPVSQNIG